ncbi:AF4/FMR2 family member 1-like [Arvicola amphibius]|uniref:AF4/FMR2 family member 1-like n=1 Tax=Arvicola amphibius TaxID=1047088 RepID=UPI0018E3D9B2|nr:AF4/FMR2 family member 1-like [Arvicola amphibius]
MSTFQRETLMENRNLLRIREKERRNQEAHPEKQAFAEKKPLFGEPYKTTKSDELSRKIQKILGDYDDVKAHLSHMSWPHCPDGSEDSWGEPKYPLFHDRESLASNNFCMNISHEPIRTSSDPGSTFVGNIGHSSNVAPPKMEPLPRLQAKNYGSPDKQHLTQDRLSQEGHSSNNRKCDHRADGESAPGKTLSPLISPVSYLSPVHSRPQGTSKVYSSSSPSDKSYCADKSSKDLKVKVQDNETPLDSLVVGTRLGVASSQTFPPPPLPSESVAMQQKPVTYIWPTDGQNQAPSESSEQKQPLEFNGQQSFEKLDVKVPAKAKLTRLKIPSQSVEQLFFNEVRCIEEILKEMTNSWLPPLTARHTPSKNNASRSPFPTKEPLPNSSATQSQNQYDPHSKTHPNSQKGTSILWEDLQLSDSEDSDTEQGAEKLPSLSAPPSAPQNLREPVVSAHSSTAETESSSSSSSSSSSGSDSDSKTDSESKSTSRDSKKSEPLEIPAPEPEPSTTNSLTKVKLPPVPLEARGSTESPSGPQENKGETRNTHQLHPECKGSPPKSSSKAIQDPTEGPLPEERSCQKSPAQQEPPPRQTIGTKQPRKPAKGSGQAEPQACLQVESKPGPPPSDSREQTSKDKPKVKAKGREPKPEAPMPKHQAAEPAPKEKRKHKGPQAPSKVPSGPQPPKDKAGNRNSFTPPHSGRGCSGSSSGRSSDCQQTANVQGEGQKRDTELLSPGRDSIPPMSLVVKINTDHLTRIPQPLGKGGSPRKAEDKQPPTDKKQDSENGDCNSSSRLSKKRKGSDSEKDHARKKIKRENDVQTHCTSSSSSHMESSKTKTSKPSSESSRTEMPSLPPVSTSYSSQKSTKAAHKRPKPDVDTCGQDPPQSDSRAKDSDNDSSVPTHRKVPKVQAKGSEYKGSSREATDAFLVPSLPNGNCKPGKPQVTSYRQQADFHMKEAIRLRYKAGAMTNKIRKAFKYLEAVLSLIECGMATESESSANSAYTVYSETADLIKFTMSLKSFSDATVPAQEKIFAVLCLRCESLVNMAMFRCKKDIVTKYSHSLSDHFKNSSSVTQECTAIPSTLSPVPSPARYVGTQSSAGGMTATVSVPVTIQNMTSAYFTITSHILQAFELWEQSEALTKKNKEFFAQLSTKVQILTLNSSLVDLVHYTRQGLQQLRQTLQTP